MYSKKLKESNFCTITCRRLKKYRTQKSKFDEENLREKASFDGTFSFFRDVHSHGSERYM